MDTHSIILGVIVIIALYIVYMYYFGNSSTSYLAGLHDAKTSMTISSSNLPGGATADYTYSVWVYVNNWNYRLGEKKPILERPGMDSMEFDSNLNNIIFTLAVSPPEGTKPVTHTCTLENVPLQAWTNIIMTLNGRALDLYMDGKLVRTCVLPGVPHILPGANLQLTPGGGFYGYTGNLQYINKAVNPRDAWAIYREGYGGSNWFSNILNKYRIKLAFMEDNREINSIEI
jgi:hypothetical protein